MNWDYGQSQMDKMIGAKVFRVAMNEDDLVFDTDKGYFSFRVEGDCCSWSYFYDIVGVRKLYANGPITSIEDIPLEADDYTGSECVQAYGYRLITESPIWGEQSTVFSFRNESNGYYGGWMEPSFKKDCQEFVKQYEITEDVFTVD